MERAGRKKNPHSYKLFGPFVLTTLVQTVSLPNGITLASTEDRHENSRFFDLVGRATALPLNLSGLR